MQRHPPTRERIPRSSCTTIVTAVREALFREFLHACGLGSRTASPAGHRILRSTASVGTMPILIESSRPPETTSCRRESPRADDTGGPCNSTRGHRQAVRRIPLAVAELNHDGAVLAPLAGDAIDRLSVEIVGLEVAVRVVDGYGPAGVFHDSRGVTSPLPISSALKSSGSSGGLGGMRPHAHADLPRAPRRSGDHERRVRRTRSAPPVIAGA